MARRAKAPKNPKAPVAEEWERHPESEKLVAELISSLFLSATQIRLLLDRLAWTPLYEDARLVLARKTPGYSDDPEIAKIQAALSVMGEVASKRGAA